MNPPRMALAPRPTRPGGTLEEFVPSLVPLVDRDVADWLGRLSPLGRRALVHLLAGQRRASWTLEELLALAHRSDRASFFTVLLVLPDLAVPLHGEAVPGDPEDERALRRLAAAIHRGVFDCVERLDHPVGAMRRAAWITLERLATVDPAAGTALGVRETGSPDDG